MKKVVIFLLLLCLVVTGCKQGKTYTKEEKQFKDEYESYNNKKQGEHEIMPLDIPEDNGIQYADSAEVVELLKGKTGVIYFGFPTCPWCRNALPVLLEARKETSLDTIYYANLLEERDTKHLEDGQIITDEEGSDNYYKILDLLKDHLGSYEGLEDESLKRLYFPTVVFVKKGKVVDIHIGTVESQKDPYQKLNKDQQAELKESYRKGIEKTISLTCDSKKAC